VGSHLSDVWFRTTDLEIVSGSGSTIRTSDGTEYLDFTAGIAVVSTGHSHPRVVAAISEQAAQVIHAQANCYRSPLPEQLADRLAQITPASIETFFFTNSGAEATEAAVKLARHATGKPNIIVVQGGFHGRTYLTMGMTHDDVEGRRARGLPAAAGRHLRNDLPASLRLGCRRANRRRARARRPARAAAHPDRAGRDRRVRDGAGAR
jgi:4-aminobutyrate aminotransferase-like enzyme